VTSVRLSKVTLPAAFWRTFAKCLPAVDSLHLGVGVTGVDQWQLMLWSHAMHRPLTVSYHIINPPLCKCECWGFGDECSCMAEMSAAFKKFGVPGVKFEHKYPSREEEEEEEEEDSDDDGY
jgi:hypothetical protein